MRAIGDSVCLGVDLGTTFTAAAIYQGGAVEPVTLGSNGWSIPSVVHLSPSGEVVCGESAAYLGASAPARTFQEFKRQFGSEIPLVTPDGDRTADWFVTRLLEHTIATAVERTGTAPDATVVTHPAGWGSYRLQLLQECVTDAGMSSVQVVPEPVAAATHYARLGRVSPGETVLIYDFGGGTFDASVVRHTGGEIQIVGRPTGSETIGGIDVDHAILTLVDELTGGLITGADVGDPRIVADLYALRQECTKCKLALTSDLRSPIRVRVGVAATEVLIQRSELEERIEPLVAETIDVAIDAVQSAGLRITALSRVLLVGGSSRIPLVGHMVSNAAGIPISVDIDAASAIAQGAAIHGGGGGLRYRGDADPSAHVALAPAEQRRAPRFVAPGEVLGTGTAGRNPSLTVRVDDGRSARAEAGSTFTLGRSGDCDLTFDDDRISRVHGTLTHDPAAGWRYSDSSSNGSFVDGVQIRTIEVSTPLTLRLASTGPQVDLIPDESSAALGVEVAGEIVYPVPGRPYVIGRRPPADIVVVDPEAYVSTRHLMLQHGDSAWEIIDESMNGCFSPDGRRLDNSTHQLTGDITLHLGTPSGPTVTFRFSAISDRRTQR